MTVNTYFLIGILLGGIPLLICLIPIIGWVLWASWRWLNDESCDDKFYEQSPLVQALRHLPFYEKWLAKEYNFHLGVWCNYAIVGLLILFFWPVGIVVALGFVLRGCIRIKKIVQSLVAPLEKDS